LVGISSPIKTPLMAKYYFLFLIILFSSCRARVSYLGSSFTPTEKIDVYVDAAAIKKPYTVVGKGYLEFGPLVKSTVEVMQKKAVEKAKAKGADAVLFQDYILKRDGSSIETISKTDSVGKGLVTVQTGTIGPVFSTGTNIFFLKYN
jgi:hypothetical protein